MKQLPSLSVIVLVLLSPCSVTLAQDPEADAKELAVNAQKLAEAKDFAAAAEPMKKAVALSPKNDLYLALLGTYELKSGKFADGLTHALAAIKLNDKNVAYYIIAAHNAYWEQDLDQARELVGHALKKGPQVIGPDLYQEAVVLEDSLVKKHYTFYWKLDPKKGQPAGGSFAIALPKDKLPYQEVSFDIEGIKSQRVAKGEVNDTLIVVPKGPEPFPLTVKVTTQPYSYKKTLARATADKTAKLPADAKTQLGPVYAIDPKSPTLKKAVAELKEESSLATVRNILAWMKKNIDYKLQQNESIIEHDFKNVDEIIKRRHAECRGYALAFVGLCRAAEVPARPIWGLFRLPPGSDPKYGQIASHNWAEVYISGAGWVPVDPQRPETLGFLPNNYVRFAMDSRKSPTSSETVPILNLMFMHGGKLRFDETR